MFEIEGDVRVLGTDEGRLLVSLHKAGRTTEFELTPQGADELADTLRQKAAWVREHCYAADGTALVKPHSFVDRALAQLCDPATCTNPEHGMGHALAAAEEWRSYRDAHRDAGS
jgi:hypothetical protein